ncbi:MAG: divergent polysaccharide deacetylase family protein [Hyphomonadaceae bacterium]|uniref:divergent polysaccharide deacetylase family protein n=1 Tax=Aquidulcibacter sp. TaxID=2052990 RepID=UPI0022BEB839|nr:divergent polysaccharide deacetylase family protein [Aquidulcibacter sp.]MCZ8207128.1 divergent polysaccharide deacetylase family protein [Aquidulcibacter sp.]
MAATQTLNAKPLAVGLKHAGMSLATLFLSLGLSAGAIQAFGNEQDAGPSAVLEVPRYNPASAKPVTTSMEPKVDLATQGMAMGWLPWRLQDGAMTPWLPGTPPPNSPSAADQAISEAEAERLAAIAKAKGDPVVTGAATAASAGQIPPASGSARIMAPSFGTATNESGVQVYRGQGGAALTQAPAAGVHQQGPGGLLPIIGPGNRTVYDAYRKPFSETGRPKVALVVGGLGLNARITQRAIDELPAEVTLSFVPYAENLQGWINKARANGHEVLIEIPMEPFDYPENDPGPHTLLTTASADENQRRLEFLLSRASGYFGVTNYLGGKFATSNESSGAIMRQLRSRGVAFIADGSASQLDAAASSAGLRNAQSDRLIDQRPSGDDIAAQLGALEAMATQRGAALGFGVAYSVTIDQIARWAKDAARRGLILAPASAVTS